MSYYSPNESEPLIRQKHNKRGQPTHMMKNSGLSDEIAVDVGGGVSDGGDVHDTLHVVDDAAPF